MEKDIKKPQIRFQGFTEEWEQHKLGDYCEMYNGDRSSKYPNASDMVDDGIPFINAGDLENGSVNLKTANNITREKYNQLCGAKLQIGDIVYCLRGTLGKNAFIDNFEEGTIASSLVAIRPKNIDGRYLYYILNSDIEYRQRIVHDEGAAQPNLSAKSVSEFEIPILSIGEQKKISEYFTKFDHLISFHQRKYDSLVKVKKSMLEKMFPRSGDKKPEIRFVGFTDDWEQRKLKEVFISLQNNTLSRAELSDKEGIAKNVHYGDILIKFGECLDIKKYTLPLIKEESIIVKYKSSFLQNGDIIVADTAEDETVGKCSEIEGLEDEIVLSGLHTIAYRPMFRFASGYLGYYMNSNLYHNQLLSLIQGIKVSSISKSAMQDTIIMYPKLIDEQAKIGEFFKQLDNLISLHQCKLNLLKNMKKAMLEKMFV